MALTTPQKIILAVIVLLIAGAAIGVGLYFGLRKPTSSSTTKTTTYDCVDGTGCAATTNGLYKTMDDCLAVYPSGTKTCTSKPPPSSGGGAGGPVTYSIYNLSPYTSLRRKQGSGDNVSYTGNIVTFHPYAGQGAAVAENVTIASSSSQFYKGATIVASDANNANSDGPGASLPDPASFNQIVILADGSLCFPEINPGQCDSAIKGGDGNGGDKINNVSQDYTIYNMSSRVTAFRRIQDDKDHTASSDIVTFQHYDGLGSAKPQTMQILSKQWYSGATIATYVDDARVATFTLPDPKIFTKIVIAPNGTVCFPEIQPGACGGGF